MDTPSFKYTALPDGLYIRLLAIHPSASLGDPLICDTETASLDDARSYSALSYTWGNPDRTHDLICDGHLLRITSNLDRALRRFRQLGTWKYIWADAVCINQSDNEEKSSQILLMRRIYQQAGMTYVYLGEQEDQPDTPNAVECLEKWILRPARSLSESSVSVSALISLMHRNKGKTTDELLKEVLRATAIPTRHDIAAWMAYQILLTRPWFSRIWVIQEATAAPERTLVQVGSFRISWNDLMAANKASFWLLWESDVNLGFSVFSGYRVAGQLLDAVEAISKWKANRVNLETMDAIAHSMHSGPEIMRILGCESDTHGRSRSFSPVQTPWSSRNRAGRVGPRDGISTTGSLDSSLSRGSAPVSTPSADGSSIENEEDLGGDIGSVEDAKSGEDGDVGSSSASSSDSAADEASKSETSDQSPEIPESQSRIPLLQGRRATAGKRLARDQSSGSLDGSCSGASSAGSPTHTHAYRETDDWADRLDATSRLQSRHLFQLLKKCCKFDATDKRDTLYGLLGLASDAELAPRAQYSKSSEEVYRQFAEYFVVQGYGPELLSMATGESTPSWVPDFGTLGKNVPGHAQGWAHRHFSRCRSGGSGPGEVHIDGDRLVVRGYIVDDEVEDLGPPLHSAASFLHHGQDPDDMGEPSLKIHEQHIMDWDKATTSFIEGARKSGLLGVHSAAEIMQQYNMTISAGDEEIHRYKSSKSIVAEVGLGSYSSEIFGASSPSRRIRDHVVDTAQERRIALTKRGLMGLVPEATKTGDILCIVLGAPAPFIVRSAGESVVLVGSAYIHNFMDGEAEYLCVESIFIS